MIIMNISSILFIVSMSMTTAPWGVLGAEVPSERLGLFKQLLELEPSIREVQLEAIDYANVKNSKIKGWHWKARARALMPDFSVGRDFSQSNNIDLDRGSTKVPDAYIEGPVDLKNGWDADISWDLGDLLFNSSHTSIDYREKSMVDLRRSLLTEVTRLFFERRRLQSHIIFTGIGTEEEHFDQLIRMDEMSALIDGLTDGFFLSALNRVYFDHPELQRLWQTTTLEYRTGMTA